MQLAGDVEGRRWPARVTASRRAPAAPPSALSKRPPEVRAHSSASRSPVLRSLICSPALCADAPSSPLCVLFACRCRFVCSAARRSVQLREQAAHPPAPYAKRGAAQLSARMSLGTSERREGVLRRSRARVTLLNLLVARVSSTPPLFSLVSPVSSVLWPLCVCACVCSRAFALPLCSLHCLSRRGGGRP